MDAVPKHLTSIISKNRVKHIPKGQIIFYKDDVASEVIVLKEGVVKLYEVDDSGNEKILHLVQPPAVMPLAFFSGNDEDIQWFYGSLTDCVVYVIQRTELEKAMQDDSAIAIYLMHWFSHEVHELLVRLSSLQKTSARSKLVTALTFLVVYHTEDLHDGWRRVKFPVSYQLLADMVGITRERSASILKKFQDENIVRYPQLNTLEINFKKLIA